MVWPITTGLGQVIAVSDAFGDEIEHTDYPADRAYRLSR